VNARWCIAAECRGEHLGDGATKDELVRHLFVIERANFLERVRKRVMTDVVEQRGGGNDCALGGLDARKLSAFREQRERAPREVIRAKRVLESGVCRPGINEVGEPELPNVSKPLKGGGVDEAKGDVIDADVVPEGIADDIHGEVLNVLEVLEVLEVHLPSP
jgi:hypothetical protein